MNYTGIGPPSQDKIRCRAAVSEALPIGYSTKDANADAAL